MGWYATVPDGSRFGPNVPAAPPQIDPPVPETHTCPECGGSKTVTTVDWVPMGDGYVPLEQAWECPTCEAVGEVSEAVKYGFEVGWLK